VFIIVRLPWLEVRKGTAVFKLYKFKQSLLSGSELEMVKEERR
jgi:hypothetical protein